VTSLVGTVWHDDSCDFILLALEDPGEDGRLKCIILDNGLFEARLGGHYKMHVNSLHKFYERIA
jgi:hypothetical protein